MQSNFSDNPAQNSESLPFLPHSPPVQCKVASRRIVHSGLHNLCNEIKEKTFSSLKNDKKKLPRLICHFVQCDLCRFEFWQSPTGCYTSPGLVGSDSRTVRMCPVSDKFDGRGSVGSSSRNFRRNLKGRISL